MRECCESCIWNEDLLCDMFGKLIRDDSPACERYEKIYKEEAQAGNGIKSTRNNQQTH